MKKVSVIMLNWNGQEYLEECLKSLVKQSYRNYEAIAVDNDSKDNSIKIIKKFKKVRLIQNKENFGFAKGNNIGIEKAKGDYIIVLNNDTKVDKDFIKELVKVAETDENIGMLSCKMLFYDNPKIINSTGLVVYKDGRVIDKNINKENKNLNKIEVVFGPCGGAAFYRKDVLERVKTGEDYFDSDFKFYYEDADLAFRIRHSGYKCLFVPKAVVYHKVNASAKKVSNLGIYYGIRNKVFFIMKNFPSRILIRNLPKILIMQIISFFYYLFKLNMVALKARISIFFDLRKMIEKRRIINPDKSRFDYYLK